LITKEDKDQSKNSNPKIMVLYILVFL